uniref:Divinyl chlorophyllide a 8-vinyl-reductase, chloroplastic n=2 Tax=Auxenochlorella protothecoides TaxID=3075 RepID=A0A1D1ZW41_AUXPR
MPALAWTPCAPGRSQAPPGIAGMATELQGQRNICNGCHTWQPAGVRASSGRHPQPASPASMTSTRHGTRRSLLSLATAGAAPPPASREPHAAKLSYADLSPAEVRVAVLGATGYIGRFVVLELVKRGFQVLAVTRPSSGIGSKQKVSDVEKALEGATVAVADVTDPADLERCFSEHPAPHAVVSCLASRTGGIADSWAVDHDANVNALRAARAVGAAHFVLLSAICVQRPSLEFQRAKLAFEAKLREGGTSWSIVRPTAFFKSLAGQVELVATGKPYVWFGDGRLAACKPISEADLASYIADCVTDEARVNRVLPIGGPGRALTPRDQAQLLFKAFGKKEWTLGLPVGIMDGVIGILDLLAKPFPGLKEAAEFGRIGRYYATESMLVWDEKEGRYDADATPEYGSDTLEAFFNRVAREGLAGQELGDQAVFNINRGT